MSYSSKIRIKDIAEMAGVSVGTVDRVIHGRNNVSKLALEKVQKVLDEIDYIPNHYASALASNKIYKFAAILPMHEPDGYWARVESGLNEGVRRFSDFKIDFRIFTYDQFNDVTFENQAKLAIQSVPDAIIIGPIFNHKIMSKFLKKLEELAIPYSLIDSYWSDFNPVSFYGQDSKRSGEFSAKIMLMAANNEKKIALFKLIGEGRVASRQQMDRETGFREYVKTHSPSTEIITKELYIYDKHETTQTLKEFFTENSDIKFALTFNSSIHLLGNFLKQEMPHHPHVTLLGYDAIERNVECLKNGSVDFLIAQQPHKQGLNSFRSTFNSTVLKVSQNIINYVPIELLTVENVDYYKD
ncbi:MAG: substrate-binding domain-containing protein [Bacteroidaceae bacterium]|nr:substrate-binding domain-containing protein [Bacteroidaceae bacterium]